MFLFDFNILFVPITVNLSVTLSKVSISGSTNHKPALTDILVYL